METSMPLVAGSSMPTSIPTSIPQMSNGIGTTTLLGPDAPVVKSKMMVWVLIGIVLLCCCVSVGVGIWYWYSSSSSKASSKKPTGSVTPSSDDDSGTPSTCDPGDRSKFEYVLRQKSGSSWVCPPGYEDTGCSWDKGQDIGSLQCRRPRTNPCVPGDQSKFKYIRRQPSGSSWACPGGYVDTGCSWNDGPKLGELQCRQPK